MQNNVFPFIRRCIHNIERRSKFSNYMHVRLSAESDIAFSYTMCSADASICIGSARARQPNPPIDAERRYGENFHGNRHEAWIRSGRSSWPLQMQNSVGAKAMHKTHAGHIFEGQNWRSKRTSQSPREIHIIFCFGTSWCVCTWMHCWNWKFIRNRGQKKLLAGMEFIQLYGLARLRQVAAAFSAQLRIQSFSLSLFRLQTFIQTDWNSSPSVRAPPACCVFAHGRAVHV